MVSRNGLPLSKSYGRLGDALRRADLQVYQTTSSINSWARHERLAPSVLPLREKLSAWKGGFFAESAAIYDFTVHDHREYLSDYQHLVRCPRINAWEGMYSHRLGLRAFLLAREFRQPETVAFIHHSQCLLHPFSPQARQGTLEEVLEQLRNDQGSGWFSMSPEYSRHGSDTLVFSRRGRAFYSFGFGREERFDLEEYLSRVWPAAGKSRHGIGGILIDRQLEQAAFWRRLFADSPNTLHLLTLWTPGAPAPFIARAVQRIGTVDTVPTDNWSGGGISAPVDLATGTLGEGRMHPLKAPPERRAQRFTQHPDSGAAIAGAVLPGWERVREVVLRAAASVPFNRMAGWDVLVDATGEPVILEANGNSDVNLLQVHGGLLAEPRIRQFYQAVGVL